MYSETFNQIVNSSTSDLYLAFVSILPRLFWALIVFLIGVLVAKWIKSLVIKALRAINIDIFIKKLGFGSYNQDVGVREKVENTIGEIVRWFIIYLFLISVFNILGITGIADFMQNLLGYLPNVLAALVIFIGAVLLAGFAESFVKNAFSSFGMVTSRLLGKIASYTVVVFGTLIALSELGIAEYFINILFIGFVLTLSIGVGLAFGLGTKDLISEVLRDWYQSYNHKSKKKKS